MMSLRFQTAFLRHALGLVVVDFALDSWLGLRFCELDIPHMVINDERVRSAIFDELSEELRKTNPNYPIMEIASESNVLEMVGWMSDSLTRINCDGLRTQPMLILALKLAEVS